jgi:hypothetical protein
MPQFELNATQMDDQTKPGRKEEDINCPVTWCCVDCGVNTAPGLKTRAEIYQALYVERKNGVEQKINAQSEVYTVRDSVWFKAGNVDGCLCIGCLETRLGRRLKSQDFPRERPFNAPRIPGTQRLLDRRARPRH